MEKNQAEPGNISKNQSYSRCNYCQAKITPENEFLPRIDYKETEILNLKQQIQNSERLIEGLKLRLAENDKKM